MRLLLDQPRTGGIYSQTSSRLGMNPAIVEKDFWVCWILKLLSAEPALNSDGLQRRYKPPQGLRAD